jgi:ribosomal protein S11
MLYKIKNLELFMDKPFFAHLNYLSKEASYFGYNISKVSLNTYKPHNGVRGKKIRRR